MVKTTVNLEDELWKKFSIKVIQDYGGRKKTDIFEALAEAFVNSPQKTIEEALEDWAKNQTKRKTKSHRVT
jgi:predicted transcriptional regulator